MGRAVAVDQKIGRLGMKWRASIIVYVDTRSNVGNTSSALGYVMSPGYVMEYATYFNGSRMMFVIAIKITREGKTKRFPIRAVSCTVF